MAITDSEKLDRILKACVQEVQSWENDNFQYAMARSDVSEERAQGKRAQGKRTQGKRAQGKRAQGKRTQGKRAQGERAQEERAQKDSGELTFVMRKKPRDFDFLLNRIAKLTARYSRKYKITLQTVFRWEDEAPAALENKNFYEKMG